MRRTSPYRRSTWRRTICPTTIWLAAWTTLSVWSFSPGAARAFRAHQTYAEPAVDGGGGGRYFTGSFADGHTCAVCHRASLGVQEEPEGVELVTDIPLEGYVPGTTYELELSLPDTTTASANLEVVDSLGAGVGALTLAETPGAQDLCNAGELPAAFLVDLPDGRRVAAMDVCGAERLRVRWTAPDVSAGPIWINAGVVGADGVPAGDGVVEIDGDQVIAIARVAGAFGDPPPEVARVGSTCAASPGTRNGTFVLATLLAAVMTLRARRRRA